MIEILLCTFPLPWITLWILRRSRRTLAPDVGVFLSFFILLYGWLPSIGIYLANEGIGSIPEARYQAFNFTQEEATYVTLAYFLMLLGFCVVYALFARRQVVDYVRVPTKRETKYIALAFLSLVTIDGVMRLYLGVPTAQSYIQSYTVLREMPLIVQQIMAISDRVQFTLLLAFMVFTIARKPRNHRYWLLGVVAIFLSATMSGGSRTSAAMYGLSYLMCYTIFVRQVSTKWWVAAAIAGITAFLILGQLRSGEAEDEAISGLQSGEFSSVFINALDLKKRTEGIYAPNVDLYGVDIARMIPQQLLWFEKIDPAAWYVNTFYPDFAQAGGGLAFGAVSEAMLGGGPLEALLRGMLLGLVMAVVSNKTLRRISSPVGVLSYIWLFLMSYQSIRDTTFTLAARYLFQIVPVIFYLWFFCRRTRKKEYRVMNRLLRWRQQHSETENRKQKPPPFMDGANTTA